MQAPSLRGGFSHALIKLVSVALKTALKLLFQTALWITYAAGIACFGGQAAFAAAFPDLLTNRASVTAPNGWTDADTDNNNDTAQMGKVARLRIHKATAGGDGEFNFAVTNSGQQTIAAPTITTAAGVGQSDFLSLEPGSYEVTETEADGWVLSALTCDDPDAGTTVTLADGLARIDLDENEDIECTFTNHRLASLSVSKQALDGTGTFDFTLTGPKLDDDQGPSAARTIDSSAPTPSSSWANILPGSYTLAEAAKTGWLMKSFSCADADSNVIAQSQDLDEDGFADATALSIELLPGTALSCSAVNQAAAPRLNATKVLSGASSYLGNGLHRATFVLSAKNTGNVPVLLSNLDDDLASVFAGQAAIAAVSNPRLLSDAADFSGTLNNAFDGESGLGGNDRNLLSSAEALLVDETITIAFDVDFQPLAPSMMVQNLAVASGTAAGLTVTDTSHHSDNVDETGEAPTPLAIDPSGVVYDAVTMQAIPGATVTMLGDNGQPLPDACLAPTQQAQATAADGFYRFDINVGAHSACPNADNRYQLAVSPPDGYNFQSALRAPMPDALNATSCSSPAQIDGGLCKVDVAFGGIPTVAAAVSSMPTGYAYTLAFDIGPGSYDVVQNHIPLDPQANVGDLTIVKTSAVTSASIGDVVPFTIEVENVSAVPVVAGRVEDRLPEGLAYIPGSGQVILSGGSPQTAAMEPAISGQQLTWDFAALAPLGLDILPPNESYALTLATRVVATASGGSLTNYAQAQNSDGTTVGGPASATIQLRPEPTFHCSSVIGRVFEDLNGDGILNHPDDDSFDAETDVPEQGIAGAKLFTVNGLWITTDALGRYSIPCAAIAQEDIGSNFALKLLDSSLPQNLVPLGANPNVIRLTPGVSSVLNFPVASAAPGQVQQTGPIYLVFGDLTARQANSALQPTSSDDVKVTGRLAAYVKGKIRGDVLLTIMADTGEGELNGLFTDFLGNDRQAYKQRIDPDRYYPVFGDGSHIDEDAPTSGRLYVRLERDSNRFVWGSVRAELNDSAFVRANKVIYGSKLHLESSAQHADQPRWQVDAYAARADTLRTVNSFRAHGGRTFYLESADVVPGSESLRIERRDAITQRVVETKNLSQGEDYHIDHLLGRIVLTAPLSDSGDPLTALDPALGSSVESYLVADYAYSSGLIRGDGWNAGGRGSIWLSENVQLGLNGQQVQDGQSEFSVLSADATIKLAETSQARVELARSSGGQARSAASTDGGLSWSETTHNSAGDAWAVDVAVDLDLAEVTALAGDLSGYVQASEAGFRSATTSSEDERLAAGLRLAAPIGAHTTLRAEAQIERLRNPLNGTQTQSDLLELRLDSALTDQLSGSFVVQSKGKRAAATTSRDTTIGAELMQQVSPGLKLGVFAVGAVNGSNREDRSRLGLSAQADVTDQLSAGVRVSVDLEGDLSVEAKAKLNRTGQGESFVGLTWAENNRTTDGLDQLSWVTGATEQLSNRLSVTGEVSRDLIGGQQNSQSQALRLNAKPWDDWTTTLAIEQSESDDVTKRAISAAVQVTEDSRQWSVGGELRQERRTDGSRRTVMAGDLGVAFKVGEDLRILAELETFRATDSRTSAEDTTYAKAKAGLAWRPADQDEWSALLMYSLLYDLPPETQLNKGQFRQIAQLINAEVSYRWNERLRLGAKFGAKTGRQSFSRDGSNWTEMMVALAAVKAEIGLTDRFDGLVEARVMQINNPNSLRSSLLGALTYRLTDEIRIGGGYNFGSVSDDLTNHSRNGSGWFLNLVGAF